ncbi:hypothetical protein BC826DRAFT_636236 [Russula brevipes]|nr:hypothetical protein BC826DRAFT_636236 [Russula brevipes]
MAVSVIRIIKRITRDNAIDWTVTALKTLSDVSPIPPLTVATNVVLSILQIVSDIKTNQQGCLSLAQRATELLMFLQKRMEGKGDAPQSLLDDIREFEITLRSIHKFMRQLTQMSRIRRGFEKSSIQEQLIQHEQKLEGARWCFQLSLSIETRYALSAFSSASSNNTPRIVDQGIIANPMGSPEAPSSLAGPSKCPLSSSEIVDQFHGHGTGKSPSPAHPIPTEEEEFLADMIGDTDEFGFHRYHQSDVIIRKSNRKTIGWFQGSSDADVCGRKMTIKRYDEEKDLALKQWVRDIKALRHLQFVTARCLVASVAKPLHVSHENLPQMLGYSNGKTPIPFILLAGVQNRALDEVMRSVLTTCGLADCASLILRTYRDIASATAHARRQLSLSEADAHHFIDSATYGVSNDNRVIIGLPPPRKRSVSICRSLETSLLYRVLKNLSELMYDQSTTLHVGPCPSQELVQFNKYMQLYGLLRSLLPHRGEGLRLPPGLEDLLDDAGEHGPLNFRALRAFGMHQFQFARPSSDESLVQPFAAGDYGYIPGGSMDLTKFVLLGNIQDSEYRKGITQVIGNAECKLFMSEHDPVICHRSSPPVATSSISDEDERECWLVPLPPNGSYMRVSYETRLDPVKHAREFLIAHGASLASKHGVEAQDLILVTRSQRYVYYCTMERPHSLRTHHAIELDSTASDGYAFPVPEIHEEMLSEPSMVYLVTSSRPDFEAYVTDEPLSASSQYSTGSALSPVGCYRRGQEETVDYVQLNVEDMES